MPTNKSSRPPPPTSEHELRERVVVIETTVSDHGHHISRLEMAVWLLGWIVLNQKLALAAVTLADQLSNYLKG